MSGGVYGATVRLLGHGRYQVALLLDTPRVLHCFGFSAKPNPVLADPDAGRPRLDLLTAERQVAVGERFVLQFILLDRGVGDPFGDIRDLSVQALLAPGIWFERFTASEVGDGMYEVAFTPPRHGS